MRQPPYDSDEGLRRSLFGRWSQPLIEIEKSNFTALKTDSQFVGWNSHGGQRNIFSEVRDMDQVKTGRFIAALRRQAGLTQESLGEKLGVTNKTVSRWENGNYMPDIEMLGLLAKEFNVSINELLSGERIPDAELRKKADETIVAVSKASVFSLEEKKSYLKRKWRREHILLFVILGLILVAAVLLPFLLKKQWLVAFAPFLALIEYCYQNNKMMAYVEKCIYG